MRTIVHLSDLHFGRVDPALVEPCIEAVHQAKPNVVVISGDLTQRARTHQFLEAKQFLERLPTPQIVVPGNHDVPLYDVIRRFARPFSKYKRNISHDLEPYYEDSEMAVVGLNTAHGFTIESGRAKPKLVARARERLCRVPDGLLKIVVTHHPFDLPHAVEERHIVRGAVSALAELVHCGADIFLAGHIHLFHSGLTTRRYRVPGNAALIIQAGTGLSTRTRGEVNAFNVIHADAKRLELQRFSWSPEQKKFTMAWSEWFRETETGWMSDANAA
jgi:3',5'-cyclic AMP phosphodiesterase CpdA